MRSCLIALAVLAACKGDKPPPPPPAPRPVQPPVPEHPAADAKPVAVRMFHQECAQFSDGELWCWGQPEIGHSESAAAFLELKRPRRVDVGGKVAAFDVGDTGIAALATGEVAVWTWTPDGAVAVRKHCAIHDAVQVGASQEFALAATRAGTLIAWVPHVADDSGACDGSDVFEVPGVTQVSGLGCTLFGCCAVHSGGKLTCVRPPAHDGQIATLMVYPIPKLRDVEAVSVTDCDALAQRRDHSVFHVRYCGGRDASLAAAGKDPFVTAENAKDLDGATVLGGGGCAIRRDGQPWCIQAKDDDADAVHLLAPGSVDFEYMLATGEACVVARSGEVSCRGEHGVHRVDF
jgi:hypothetical protein